MIVMSNLENLAKAIGKDIKGIKEQQVTKDELEKKGYLTSHQDLSSYAKKAELYNDTDIKRRLGILENKRDNDNQTLSLSGKRLSLTNGGSVELPIPDTPVYRISKTDIPGGGIGTTATITADNLMNPDGVKIGDIIQDFFSSSFGTDEGYWKVTSVVNERITVTWLGSRFFPKPYNDSDLQRRVSALERRPSFDALTPTQRNSLKGEPGKNILNQNNGQELKYWVGTSAQYNAISNKDPNTIYDVYD